MDAAEFLRYLKWVAIALVPLSALWGLLGRKPTIETERGNKRLTGAGLVTVAVISTSALGSALSFHFETQLNERKKAQEQRDKDAQTLQQMRRDAVARVTQANSAKILWQQQARDEKDRADRAEQRALLIATAAEARERDLALGRRVGEGAARNLRRTSDALLEIERLQQPLTDLTVSIGWELPAGTPGLALVTEPARLELERQIASDNAIKGWHTVDGRPPRRSGIAFCPQPALWQKFARNSPERRLIELLRSINALLVFSPKPLTGAEVDALERGRDRTGGDAVPEMFLPIGGRPFGDRCALNYSVTGSLLFSTAAEFPVSSLKDSTAVISYPDLERANGYLLILREGLHPAFRPHVRVRSVEIWTANRRYSVPAAQLRDKTAGTTLVGLLELPRLGPARRP